MWSMDTIHYFQMTINSDHESANLTSSNQIRVHVSLFIYFDNQSKWLLSFSREKKKIKIKSIINVVQ